MAGTAPDADGLQLSLQDEALGHSGFQPAGTFTKQKRSLQTDAAAGQMLAIDKQMQDMLIKMQRHNSLISARHLQEAKDVHTLQHPAASGNFGGISSSSELQSKLDMNLAQIQSTPAQIVPAKPGMYLESNAQHDHEVTKPSTPGQSDRPSPGNGVLSGAAIGPLWGATEGGRDKMGWVRQLVKYTETHPIYIPDAASSAVQVLEDGHIQKTVFPSLKPNRREDALLLQQWLAEMMAQLTSNAPQAPEDHAQMEMADAALWLYGIAFQELQRHVGIECRERAQVMACLWEHSRCLIELRCAIQYETLLTQSRSGHTGLVQQKQYLKGQISELRSLVETISEERSADAQQAQRQIEVGARQLAAAQQQLQLKADIIHQLTGGLQAETEQKENLGNALAEARKALDESRQDRGALRYEVDAKNRRSEALATELHLTETTLSERQAEVVLLKQHERDYLLRIAGLEESNAKLKRAVEQKEVLLLAVREQLAVREKELAQSQAELAEQKGRCRSMEGIMNAEVASRERTERELRAAIQQINALQEQLDRMSEMRQEENKAFRKDLDEANTSKAQLSDQLSDARAEAASWQHQLTAAEEKLDALKERLKQERVQKLAIEQESEGLVNKLASLCSTMEETGLTQLDFKAAKVPLLAEVGEAIPIKKHLAQATPSQIVDLCRQRLNKVWQRVPELEKSTAVAVEKMKLEEAARRKLEERLITTKTALSRLTREQEQATASLLQAQQAKATAEVEVAELHTTVESREGQVEGLEQELKVSKAEVNRLQPLETRVMDLMSELQQIRADKDRCADALTRLEAWQGVATKTMETGAAQVAHFKQQLQEKTEQLATVQAEYSDMQAAKESQTGDLGILQSQLDAKDAHLQDATRQLNVLKFMLSNVSTEDTSGQVQKLETETAKLKAELVIKTKQSDILVQRIANSRSQVEQAAQASTAQEQQMTQLHAQIAAKDQFIATLRATLNNAASDRDLGLGDRQRSDVATMESPSTSARITQDDGVSPRQSSSPADRTLSRRQSVVLMHKNARRQSGVSQLSRESSTHRSIGADLATEVLEATLANSNATVQQLQEQAQVTEAAHSIDVQALNEQLAAANASLATKQVTIRRLQKELEELQDSASATFSPKLAVLQAQLEGTQQELAALQAKYEASEQRFKEVQALLQQSSGPLTFGNTSNPSEEVKQVTEALQAAHKQQTLWLRVRAAFMAGHARHVRHELAVQTSAKAELELAAMQQQIAGLEEQLQQQQDFAHTLDKVFQKGPELASTVQEQTREAQQEAVALQQDIVAISEQMAPAMEAFQAAHPLYQPPPSCDQACQANQSDVQQWLDFLSGLSRGRPKDPLTRQEVVAGIVRCYMCQVDRLSDQPRSSVAANNWTSDAQASDSIFDALAEACSSGRAVRETELLLEAGPVGRLVTSARMYQNDVKVHMFCRFLGLVDGHIPAAGWRFFVQMLHCLKAMQGQAWQATLQEWQSSEGALLPIQCLMDVLANAYNDNSPATLPVAQQQLLPLMQNSRMGPALDLDTFLQILISECLLGNCPCKPLLLPRRVTDGGLANALNLKHDMGGSGSTSERSSPPDTPSSRFVPSRLNSGRLTSTDGVRPRPVSGRSASPGGIAAAKSSAQRQLSNATSIMEASDEFSLPAIPTTRTADIFTSLSSLTARTSPRPGSPLQRSNSRSPHLAGPTTSVLPPIPDGSF